MKKYFAKYIPVEERIKTGDLYFNHKTNSIQERLIGTDDKSYIGFKKAVLFLCTRELNVGDILSNCNRDNKERKIHHFETVLPYGVWVFEKEEGREEEWIRANEAWKIIALISSNALWVKEEDEFDEEDWKLYHGNTELAKKFDYGEPLALYIKIKGSCGHFH